MKAQDSFGPSGRAPDEKDFRGDSALEVALRQVGKLLSHCPDAECPTCAAIICPHQCSMHFHHDGCPACAEHETEQQ